MARQIVNLGKLAEAQQAADAGPRKAAHRVRPLAGRNPPDSGASPAHGDQQPPDLPFRVGPASALGALVAVRCPHDLDPLMRQAGGEWEPGASGG